MLITSRANPCFKRAQDLLQKKHRQAKREFLLEGARGVEAALAAGAPVAEVFLTPEFGRTPAGERLLALVQAKGIEIHLLEETLLANLASTKTPPGLLAVVRQPTFAISDGLAAGDFFVLVDGIQDPGNLGSIIRTADAAGVAAVFLSEGTVDLFNPKVIRATMGSIFHLPVIVAVREEILRALRNLGVRLIAGDVQAKTDVFTLTLTGTLALAVGNENQGLHPDIIAMADLAAIPMVGQAESLNVAAAAAIMLYEAVRQRRLAGSLLVNSPNPVL